MDEQHRACGVVRERFQCLHVARGWRVANDVHRIGVRPVGGQHRVEPRPQCVAQCGQRHAFGGGGVGRHHASATAVGEHDQLISVVAVEARERFSGEKQVLQGVHAQHAGACNRRVEHRVRPGECTGVRGGGLLAGDRAPGLDHDHRFVARRGARGRHEFARLLDALDVEQDGAGRRVAAQEVEHVAEVDIGAFTERDKVREADAARARPVEHGGDECTRLRHERQLSRQRADVREAGIEAQVRHQHADAVGPEDAQRVHVRCVEHGLLLRASEAGGQHDRRPGAACAEFGDQLHHRGGWRAQNGQLRRGGQRIHRGPDLHAIEFSVLGVDRVKHTLEVAVVQVAPHRSAHAGGPHRGPDHRDRSGCEEGVEVANAHGAGRWSSVLSAVAGLSALRFDAIQASSEERMASSTDMSIGVIQVRGTKTV